MAVVVEEMTKAMIVVRMILTKMKMMKKRILMELIRRTKIMMM